MYVILRPIMSDSDAQKMRPAILNSDSSPANAAAIVATWARWSSASSARRSRHRNQAAAENFLQHRRSHADHADARTHVQAQHAPEQPELRRAHGFVHVHVIDE